MKPAQPLPDTVMILTRSDGSSTAYCRESGRNPPGIVFLPGFRSDMNGIKATALAGHCRSRDHAFLRFDYFGHGASSGDFRAGTIGRWLEDALAVIDRLTEGPQILVGSSMGGWIALLEADGDRGRGRADRGWRPPPLPSAGSHAPVRRGGCDGGAILRPFTMEPLPSCLGLSPPRGSRRDRRDSRDR